MTASASGLSRWWAIAGFAVLLLWLAFGRLGATSFWGNHAESRRAEVGRELLAHDANLLVPRLGGDPFLTKPPLFYWLVYASYRLTGEVSEATARLPSAAMGLLGLWFAFAAGRAWRNVRTGLLAAGLLATTVLYAWQMRACEIDLTFATLITGALAGLVRAVKAGPAPAARPAYLGFWLFTALAFMAKGPFAVLFPLAGFVACRHLPGGEPRPARPTWRQWLTPWGLGLFALLVLPWFLYAFLQVRGTGAVLTEETLDRLTSATMHTQPFWYYLPHLGDLGLWVLLLPPALVLAWHRRDAVTRLLLGFAGGGWLIASAIASKKGVYLLPLFPALTLLIAAALDELYAAPAAWPRLWRYMTICLRVIAVVLAAGGVALALGLKPPDRALALLLALVGGGALALAWQTWRRATQPAGLAAAVAALLLLAAAGLTLVLPLYNDRQGVKSFAERVGHMVPPGAPLFMVEGLDNYSVPFYARRVVPVLRPGTPPRYDGSWLVARRASLPELAKLGTLTIVLENRTVLAPLPVKDKRDLVLLQFHRLPDAAPPPAP